MNNHLRLALITLMATTVSACNGGGAKFGDMALPADCEGACPTGYSCDNGVCTGGNAQAVAINLVTYPVAGTLLVNGQPPAPAPDCSNRNLNIDFTSDISTLDDGFFQQPQATTVSDTLDCSNSNGAIAVRLPAGSYSVFTQSYESEPNVPNGVMPIQSGKLNVSGAIAAATWSANTVTVSGKITINGAAPTATEDCSQDQLTVTFTNDSGATFFTTVPCTVSTGAFSLQLPPATYTVLANGTDGASSFPTATMVVQSSLAVSGAVSGLALAATTVPVSGTVTINGAPPAATTLCGSTQMTITFSDAAGSSYSADIDCTNATGTFSLAVAPGTYKVTAQTEGPVTSFPAGSVVLASSLKVSSAMSNVALSTKTVSLSGTLTVDGATPEPYTGCSSDQATLTFTSADGSSLYTTIPCGATNGAWSIAVPAGKYVVQAQDLSFNPAFSGDSIVTVQPSLSVAGALTNVTLTAKTTPVSGTLTVDGAPLGTSSSCSGDLILLSFVDAAGAVYEADIDCTDTAGAFSLRLASGTYRVLAHAQGETTLGWGAYQLVGALRIP